jgi:serine protease inhibitor
MSPRGRDLVSPAAVGALLIATSLLPACGGGSDASSGAPPVTTTVPPSVSTAPPAVLQAKEADIPVDPTIVTADNTFGLNLLNTLIAGNAGQNTAISPLSVAMTLQILYNGAAGTTQTTMAQTLQLGDLGVSQLNSDNAALLGALLDPDPQVNLTIANSLWVPLSTNTVSPTFTSTDQTYYGAEIGDVAGAPANVNAWVSAQTNGLITELLPPGNYDTVLANTVYFKGQWTTQFSLSQTISAPFTLADGTQTPVQTMQQSNSLPYLQGTNFQAVSLPYGSGRLSMLIVLPDTGVDPGALVATITPATIDSWVAQMTMSATINLSLPKFTATFATNLMPALTTLGMGEAFDPAANGFPGIFPGFYVNVAEHKTYVQVDESGTVAAAATGVGVTSVMSLSVNLQVNHPFFYAIRDNQTAELLFVGVLMNPSAG